MARFRLTPEAETQIGDIVEFIAAERENAALRVRDALYDAFELLAAHPGIGHAREDLTPHALKVWSVSSFLVVYDPRSEPVTIIAVLHGARDAQRLLGDIVP